MLFYNIIFITFICGSRGDFGSNLPCQLKKSGVWRDHLTSLACKDIVNRPRKGVINKICTCQNGKWIPEGVSIPINPIDRDGNVNAAFFGNIIGHAQLLCNIFEAITCWQKNPKLPKIPGLNKQDNSIRILSNNNHISWYLYNNITHTKTQCDMTPIKNPMGEEYLVDQKGILDVVSTICGVINGGTNILPGILPGLIDKGDEPRNGLPWILPRIIERLKTGLDGIIDLVELIDFFDIFSVTGENSEMIKLYNYDR